MGFLGDTFRELPVKHKIKAVLAIWSGMSSFFLLVMMYWVKLPEHQVTLVNTLSTMYMSGSILLVYSYYFGDSDTSPEKKDDTP